MAGGAASGLTRPAQIRLAVVIPAYRQPEFLAAAATSALDQQGVDVGVVVVNDGCPFASTHETGLALSAADPMRVTYLRQDNAGVSAARNAGIRHALQRWPAIDAIFALDADNRLAPHTLQRLWSTLRSQPPAAWTYPSLEFFGEVSGIWDMPATFSRFRQLFENQCDTGSLVGREIYDAGIFFEQDMRAGYEDWEFFVRATLAGFAGVHGGRAGFGYRRHDGSMLSVARRDHERLWRRIRGYHLAAYHPRSLTRLEHEELPRFALVSGGVTAARTTSSLDLEPRRRPYTELIGADDAPPISALGTEELWAALERLRVLPGVLLRTQEALRRHPAVGLTLTRNAGASGLTLREAARSRGRELHGVIAPTSSTRTGAWPEPATELRLDVGTDLLDALPAPCVTPVPAIGVTPAQAIGVSDARQPLARAGGSTHTDFGFDHHVLRLQTTFPHGAGGIWLVAETVGPSTVELAGELHRDDPARGLHLAVTGDAMVRVSAQLLDIVDTVSLLGELDPARATPLLARTLESADVVLVLDAMLGYLALAEVDVLHAPVRVAVVAELERDEFGVPGETLLTAVTAGLDRIDVFLAATDRIAHQLADLGVARDRIAVAAMPSGAAAALRAGFARTALDAPALPADLAAAG